MKQRLIPTSRQAGLGIAGAAGIAAALALTKGCPPERFETSTILSTRPETTIPDEPSFFKGGFTDRFRDLFEQPTEQELQHQAADDLAKCVRERTAVPTTCRTHDDMISNNADYAPRVALCTAMDETGTPTGSVATFIGEICIDPTYNPHGCNESTFASLLITGQEAATLNHVFAHQEPWPAEPGEVFYPFEFSSEFQEDRDGKSELVMLSQADTLQALTADVTSLCDEATLALESPTAWDELAYEQQTVYDEVTQFLWDEIAPLDVVQLDDPGSFYEYRGLNNTAVIELQFTEDDKDTWGNNTTSLIARVDISADDPRVFLNRYGTITSPRNMYEDEGPIPNCYLSAPLSSLLEKSEGGGMDGLVNCHLRDIDQ